eukprot:EG_transcript_39866
MAAVDEGLLGHLHEAFPHLSEAFIREVLQEHRSTTEAVQYMLAYQCHGPDMEDPDTRGTEEELPAFDRLRAMFCPSLRDGSIHQALACTDGNVDQAVNLLLMQGAVYAPPSCVVAATRMATRRAPKPKPKVTEPQPPPRPSPVLVGVPPAGPP